MKSSFAIWTASILIIVAMGHGADLNLALNKPVTVDGATEGENLPAKAVDGDATNASGWHSGKSPAWLQVDLGKIQQIDRAAIYPYYDGIRYYQYAIEASSDGERWTRVVDMSANKTPSSADGNEHCFAATPARYVRVHMLKNSANAGIHLNEIMLFEAAAGLQPLTLERDRTLRLGGGGVALTFADSHAQTWDLTRTLLLADWSEGKDRIQIKGGAAGLTPTQLQRIGFLNPSSKEPGIYHALLQANGELVPSGAVVPIDPPFDLSEKACVQRAKLYEVPGRANLSGKDTPLKDNMTIALCGDSLTWQNVYPDMIRKSLKDGEGTKGMKIEVLNHGINGGGVINMRDGDKDVKQNFAQFMAENKATVTTIFLGVNDVWWRKTTLADFEQALRDMIKTARDNQSVPVLATLAIWGETAIKRNPKCDEYANITRKVAADTGTTLVDIRKAFMAYHENNGWKVQVDGSLIWKGSLLTYDGVHGNTRGYTVIADLISQGIYEALKAE